MSVKQATLTTTWYGVRRRRGVNSDPRPVPGAGSAWEYLTPDGFWSPDHTRAALVPTEGPAHLLARIYNVPPREPGFPRIYVREAPVDRVFPFPGSSCGVMWEVSDDDSADS